MKIYRVTRNARVEAKTAGEAERLMEENNSVAKCDYYFGKEDAYEYYNRYAEKLSYPHSIGRGLYWFDCVSVDWADGCDVPQEEDEIEECFYSGTEYGIDFVSVGRDRFCQND